MQTNIENIYAVGDAIKKDGKWGALDKDGNIINGINDNLDENLLIDYIGKYHLGKDINLLYYTD